MTTTSENDKQANCRYCGYKVSAAGFMCIPCANKLVNSEKQGELAGEEKQLEAAGKVANELGVKTTDAYRIIAAYTRPAQPVRQYHCPETETLCSKCESHCEADQPVQPVAPVATDWERTARVQDAKLRAMCGEPGGFEKLCEVLDRYEKAQPVQPAGAQGEPVAFYGLGSQLYGMDGRPVKFSLGTQFYAHPPAGVVRELVRATEELKYAIHMEVCLINALDRVDAALKSAKEHGL